jgi:undecaprenyl-diphosphatase
MALTILQQLILGAIQGITEWIPISSSAALVLVMTNFFGITDIHDLITGALFFHLGTFFAALIYFRKEVARQFNTLFHYKSSNPDDQKVLVFLVITTIISGIIGLLIIKALYSLQGIEITGKVITLAIGFMLLFTGVIQIKIKVKSLKKAKDLKTKDSFILGLAQGAAALPGISRSGITVSALLLKRFDDTTALKLSFLMSLPIILIGNIFLNLHDYILTVNGLFGLLASFVFGLLTIHLLMKLSKRINFGWFVIIFGVLMMVSVLV